MYLGYICPLLPASDIPKINISPSQLHDFFFTLSLSHAVELEMSIYALVWDNLLEQEQSIVTTPQGKVTLSYPEVISCQ